MKRLKKLGSPRKKSENNLLKIVQRSDSMEDSIDSIDSFQCSSPESMDGSSLLGIALFAYKIAFTGAHRRYIILII